MLASPVAKRQHRHEELRSSYISGRATSFAERQVERRLAEARKVEAGFWGVQMLWYGLWTS